MLRHTNHRLGDVSEQIIEVCGDGCEDATPPTAVSAEKRVGRVERPGERTRRAVIEWMRTIDLRRAPGQARQFE